MSLQLIYGRAGSGKGEKVKDLAFQNNGLLIVPETYTLEAEKKMCSLSGAIGLSGTEVSSFKRLAHSLSDNGPLGAPSVDPCGKVMALSIIAEKLRPSFKILKASSEKSGFSKSVLKLISEFKRYSVSAQILKNAASSLPAGILSSKLHDISLIYEEYTSFLSSGYKDSDDDLEKLCEILSEQKPLSGRKVYIDRYTSLSPAEYKVIGCLLKECSEVTVTLPCVPESLEFQFIPAQNTGEKLKELAKELNVSVNKDIILTPSSFGELSHLEKNFFSFDPKVWEKDVCDISLFCAKTVYSEVEYIAREILNLVRNGGVSYKDIAIIARDADSYAPIVKSVFNKAKIPYTYTESTPADGHPLVSYLISAVETVTSNFSSDPLFKYLKSAFSDIEQGETDVFENYILASGVRGTQFTNDEKWNFRTSAFSSYDIGEGERQQIDAADATRKKILPSLLSLKKNLSGKITADYFCSALYTFMEETHLEEKVLALSSQYEKEGQTDESMRLLSVYNGIISAMDSLIACSGKEEFYASKFNTIFKEGLSAQTLSIIPSSYDCVNYLSAPHSEGNRFKFTFLAGLNEGVFPAIPSCSGILSDSDRNILKDHDISLAPDSEFLNYDELSLLYGSLTASFGKLFLSYPLCDVSGKALRPSYVVSTVKEIFPMLKENNDLLPLSAKELVSAPGLTITPLISALNGISLGNNVDKDWLKVYGWFKEKDDFFIPRLPNTFYAMSYAEKIDPSVTNVLFPDGFKTSISRLESYSSCPFKYYMTYILKAKPRKIAEMTPADTGSVLHYYIESTSKYMLDHALSWQDVTNEELKKVASEVTNEIIQQSSTFIKNSSRALFQLKRLELLSYKMLLLIKRHFESGMFEPLGYEITFDRSGEYPEIKIETDFGVVNLTGKIDRADIFHSDKGDFIRIIDYKSGHKSFDFSSIYHGLNLQLSIYMLALTENTGASPAGMLYFRLDDPLLKGHAAEEKGTLSSKRDKELKLSGLLLDDGAILDAMDKNAQGDSSLLPFKKKPASKKDNAEFLYTGSLATIDNFNSLFRHAKKTVARIVGEMKKGAIDINPSAISGSPCEYCDFKDVCLNNGMCNSLNKVDEKNPWDYFENDYVKEVDNDEAYPDAK